MRRPVIGVMGSGSDPHEQLATDIGRLLARLGVHLLTGGGRGVMESVSRAYCETPGRKGLSIGVIPAASEQHPDQPKPGYPNEWVELAISTHLPFSGSDGTSLLSRNHINVLSSDAIVLLPGSAGTLSEAQLALRYTKPVIAYLGNTRRLPPDLQRIPLAASIDDVEHFVMGITDGR